MKVNSQPECSVMERERMEDFKLVLRAKDLLRLPKWSPVQLWCSDPWQERENKGKKRENWVEVLSIKTTSSGPCIQIRLRLSSFCSLKLTTMSTPSGHDIFQCISASVLLTAACAADVTFNLYYNQRYVSYLLQQMERSPRTWLIPRKVCFFPCT